MSALQTKHRAQPERRYKYDLLIVHCEEAKSDMKYAKCLKIAIRKYACYQRSGCRRKVKVGLLAVDFSCCGNREDINKVALEQSRYVGFLVSQNFCEAVDKKKPNDPLIHILNLAMREGRALPLFTSPKITAVPLSGNFPLGFEDCKGINVYNLVDDMENVESSWLQLDGFSKNINMDIIEKFSALINQPTLKPKAIRPKINPNNNETVTSDKLEHHEINSTYPKIDYAQTTVFTVIDFGHGGEPKAVEDQEGFDDMLLFSNECEVYEMRPNSSTSYDKPTSFQRVEEIGVDQAHDRGPNGSQGTKTSPPAESLSSIFSFPALSQTSTGTKLGDQVEDPSSVESNGMDDENCQMSGHSDENPTQEHLATGNSVSRDQLKDWIAPGSVGAEAMATTNLQSPSLQPISEPGPYSTQTHVFDRAKQDHEKGKAEETGSQTSVVDGHDGCSAYQTGDEDRDNSKEYRSQITHCTSDGVTEYQVDEIKSKKELMIDTSMTSASSTVSLSGLFISSGTATGEQPVDESVRGINADLLSAESGKQKITEHLATGNSVSRDQLKDWIAPGSVGAEAMATTNLQSPALQPISEPGPYSTQTHVFDRAKQDLEKGNAEKTGSQTSVVDGHDGCSANQTGDEDRDNNKEYRSQSCGISLDPILDNLSTYDVFEHSPEVTTGSPATQAAPQVHLYLREDPPTKDHEVVWQFLHDMRRILDKFMDCYKNQHPGSKHAEFDSFSKTCVCELNGCMDF